MLVENYQKGQILLIVVLVMVTTLTIGLSVAARSITNIRTSQDSASSERAFSAAEAGIEESLTNNTATAGAFLSNHSSYSTSMITVAGTDFALNNGSPILKDASSDVWLSTYPKYTNQWTGDLTIYWGQPSDQCSASGQPEISNTNAALEVIVLSGSPNTPQMTRYAFDPCSPRNGIYPSGNSFQPISAGGGTVAGQNYMYRSTLPTITNGIFVRIIPLYAPALVAVRGSNGSNTPLPAQGTVIQSTGIADTTQRKLITYRYYPQLSNDVLQYTFFVQ